VFQAANQRQDGKPTRGSGWFKHFNKRKEVHGTFSFSKLRTAIKRHHFKNILIENKLEYKMEILKHPKYIWISKDDNSTAWVAGGAGKK
jgi:hypothetical protein